MLKFALFLVLIAGFVYIIIKKIITEDKHDGQTDR